VSEAFEWEVIDNYPRLTGIDPVDKAMAYEAFEVPLKQHLARREREQGRDAAAADLTALIASTPPGSPAHNGSAVWLRRLQAGASVADL
jgi:hypothetical protein